MTNLNRINLLFAASALATASAAHAITDGSGEATISVSNQWGSGYCADVSIANNGSANISNWTVGLGLNGANITNLWNGNLSGDSVSPAPHNANIAPSSSTSFGFCANGSATPTLTSLEVEGGGSTSSSSSSSSPSSSSSSSSTDSGSNSITVRMSGVVGDESVSLEIGGQTIETWTLSIGMLDYTVNTDATGELRVAFTNDSGDRDVQVDYVMVNNVTHQAEDQEDNTGAWDGECGAGSYSEMLHCSGSIGFGNPFDGSSSSSSSSSSSGNPGNPDFPEFFVGNITTNGSVRSDFTQYWDQITPENEGKWGSVEGTRDQYNWGPLDDIYDYARASGIPVKAHVLVWGSQRPSWIDGLSAAEQRAEIEEWIVDYCERYPDTEMIDVVNEALPSHAPANYAENAYGSDWITESFRLAREHCPNAVLIYNDYNFMTWDTDAIIDMIRPAVNSGYVDAIGLQAHGLYNPRVWSAQEIEDKLDQIASLGLPLYISEYDIQESNDQQQLEYMQTHFPIFYNHPDVAGITLWGYVVGATWREGTGLMTSNGQQRPAMQWLMEYLNR
ncbi:endo-1,4-beta-xylanase [Gilvimarinus xylanilyticus]|uniref:Beta-xylanase n=1 Tax=Gilvimarinus xylanilyticus TaxID=2944139 RepID=A0A9X2KRG2_9GAMM|nr:endo-1,4-beta-xylanase [Gilvimarinus xylanilyticus]MCP8897821.1 endo-1,4-beta-xylanase [Gilvimarinus xylanilyticus]